MWMKSLLSVSVFENKIDLGLFMEDATIMKKEFKFNKKWNETEHKIQREMKWYRT